MLPYNSTLAPSDNVNGSGIASLYSGSMLSLFAFQIIQLIFLAKAVSASDLQKPGFGNR